MSDQTSDRVAPLCWLAVPSFRLDVAPLCRRLCPPCYVDYLVFGFIVDYRFDVDYRFVAVVPGAS